MPHNSRFRLNEKHLLVSVQQQYNSLYAGSFSLSRGMPLKTGWNKFQPECLAFYL